MRILMDPDLKGMVGTLYPTALHTLQGLGIEPLIVEIWAFFQILGNFFFEAMNSHRKCIFHHIIVKIKYNVQKYTKKIIFKKKIPEKCCTKFFYYSRFYTKKIIRQL